jgi:hypothetical protein
VTGLDPNAAYAAFGRRKRAGYMAATLAEDVVTSGMSDIHDLPLDFDVDIDAAEYARIMRPIGIGGDEEVAQVSAFNSSI